MDINLMSQKDREKLHKLTERRQKDRQQISIRSDLPFGMDAWNAGTKRYLAWRRGHTGPLSLYERCENIPKEININGNVLDWKADFGYYQMRNKNYRTAEESTSKRSTPKLGKRAIVDKTADAHPVQPASFECAITKDFDEVLAALEMAPPFHPSMKKTHRRILTPPMTAAGDNIGLEDAQPRTQSSVQLEVRAPVAPLLPSPTSPSDVVHRALGMQPEPIVSPQPTLPPPRVSPHSVMTTPVPSSGPSAFVQPVNSPASTPAVPCYAFPPLDPFALPRQQPNLVTFCAARNLPQPLHLPVRVVSPETAEAQRSVCATPTWQKVSPTVPQGSSVASKEQSAPYALKPLPTSVSAPAPAPVPAPLAGAGYHLNFAPASCAVTPTIASQRLPPVLPPLCTAHPALRSSQSLDQVSGPSAALGLIPAALDPPRKTHYHKGARVTVVRGTYAGLHGVVKGPARPSAHIAPGQWSVHVRMHSGRDVPVMLPPDFLASG